MNKTSIFKRMLISVLAIAMVLTAIPMTTVTAQAAPTAIKKVVIKQGKKNVTKKTIKLAAGKSTKIKVTVTPSKAKKSIKYVSGNKKVATVSKNGKIKAKAAGTTKIKVTVTGKNKKKKTAWVKVKVTGGKTEDTPSPQPSNSPAPSQAPAPQPSVAPSQAPAPSSRPDETTVDVESVAFDQTSYSVEKGKSTQALVTVLPENATNKNLKFTSADPTIVTVTDAGIIFGAKAGTTTITVSSNNGKSATATVTVTEPFSIALSDTSLILGVNQVGNLTANAAGVTWSSDNEAIATVDANGKVTAVKPGVAHIIAAVGGVSASCEVTVTKYDPEKVGVTLSVFNPIKNNDGSVIDNTVLINQDMVIQAYVEQNATALKGRRVTLNLDKIDYANVDYEKFDIKVNGQTTNVSVTDENGIAEFTVSYSGTIPSTYDNEIDCPYVSFMASTTVDNVPNEENLTIKFASVLRKGIQVDNNRDVTLDDIIPFDGHAEGDDGIQTTWNTNDYYADEYVTSQQVGNPVYLSATPVFVLPPERKDSQAKFNVVFPSKKITPENEDIKVEGNGATESYTIYNDGTDTTTTTSILNIPEGVVSMSVYFNKISVSKYSQLYIDLYEYEDGVIGNRIFHKNYTEFDKVYEKEEGVQVDNVDRMQGRGILIVSIQSPGQIDVSTTGYSLSRVTGDFNANKSLLPEEIEIVDSVIWSDVTKDARYQVAESMKYDDIIQYLPEYVGVENSYLIDSDNYSFSYRLPTFNSNAETANAITGNALLIATYNAPDGTKKTATYAYPVIRDVAYNGEPKNTNTLMKKTDDIKAIFLGYDVIDANGDIQQTTGGIKTNGNQAVITSTSDNKSGAIFVGAKLKIDALQKEIDIANKTFDYNKSPIKGADNKYPLYSYVQFVAKPEAIEEDGVVPTFYAVEDQYIVVTAKVSASNKENQTDQEIDFYYGESKITPSTEGKIIGKDVVVKSVDEKTNSDGEAYLVLVGHEASFVDDIQVEYKGSFATLETFAGGQRFEAIKQGNKLVNKCNLYWLDLGLAYEKEVATDTTDGWDYNYESGNAKQTTSNSVVSKKWKIGFLPVAKCSNGEFDVDFNTLQNTVTPKNLFVGITNVGVNYKIGGDNTAGCITSVDTTGDGTKRDVAIITSDKIGTTKVNGALRLDGDSASVTYYDSEGELKTINTVGVNTIKLNSKTFAENISLGGEFSYTMEWIPGNWESEFIFPYGNSVAVGQDIKVYFRLHDKYNNPVKNTDVVVSATQDGNSYSSFEVPAKTDDNGLVAINVSAPDTECSLLFTVTVSDIYTTTSVPVVYTTVPENIPAVGFDGDPVIKTEDNKTVTLKFNNDVQNEVLTNDMLKKLFIVKDNEGRVLEIDNVVMNFDRVMITLKDSFIQNSDYSVTIATGNECEIGGVVYVLYDKFGQAVKEANATKSFTAKYTD